MDTWTVLLIGGPAATRKTSVAKTIAARCGAEALQADDVWLALQRAIDPDTRPTLHFFARVASAYAELAEVASDRIVVIDGAQPPASVLRAAVAAIDRRMTLPAAQSG